MPNRLAAIPKPIRDSSHLWIVADQQTAIAFHVMLDRRHPFCRIFGTRDTTTMCDDLMPALYERCRVIGANVVAHQKQNFHLIAAETAEIVLDVTPITAMAAPNASRYLNSAYSRVCGVVARQVTRGRSCSRLALPALNSAALRSRIGAESPH